VSDGFLVRPIGFVRSPFAEKVDAPRQAVVADDALGRIEVLPEHEHALEDLAGFDRVWVVSWFDRAARPEGGGPGPSKVLPPRSDVRRGVFATRSPHRPNPIGLSAVRLERVEGLVVHVRGLDLVDGTPVLDLKPYLPYADAFPDARAGWLEAPADPRPAWEVRFEAAAEAALAWIVGEGGPDLRPRIASALALGPQPHPYRRIKKLEGDAALLSIKEWRARFREEEGKALVVTAITSGYRPRELAAPRDGEPEALALHRAFVARAEEPR